MLTAGGPAPPGRSRSGDGPAVPLAVGIVSFGFVAALAGLLVAAMSVLWSPGDKVRVAQQPGTVTGATSGPAGGLPRTSPAELWAAIGGDPAAVTASPGGTETGAEPAVVTGFGGAGATPRAVPSSSGPAAASPVPSAVGPVRGSSSPAAVRPVLPPGATGDAVDLLPLDVADRVRAAVGQLPAPAPAATPPPPAPDPQAPTPTNPPAALTPPPEAITTGSNLLDADSAGFEQSVGNWKEWFSNALTSGANDGYTGSRSLRVRITAPHGWGVELKIWPGFPASPGRYVIGFAARAESGGVSEAKMTVHWHRGDIEIGSTELDMALSDSWQWVSGFSTAPAGTTHVRVDFRNRSGGPNDRLLLDDIVVVPAAG